MLPAYANPGNTENMATESLAGRDARCRFTSGWYEWPAMIGELLPLELYPIWGAPESLADEQGFASSACSSLLCKSLLRPVHPHLTFCDMCLRTLYSWGILHCLLEFRSTSWSPKLRVRANRDRCLGCYRTIGVGFPIGTCRAIPRPFQHPRPTLQAQQGNRLVNGAEASNDCYRRHTYDRLLTLPVTATLIPLCYHCFPLLSR